MACNCPIPTALTAITATSCPEELGQIQRFIFVRKGEVVWDTVTPANNVPATITLDAPTATVGGTKGWSILIPAADDTKTILSPLVGGDPVINPGEQITQGGGDNSTLNGQVYHVAFNPAEGSFRFDSMTAQQTYELKLLVCEDLEVYLINADGDIIGHRDRDSSGVNEDTWHGFPITNAAFGGRSVQGFASRDSNVLTLQLNDDWDSYFEKQTPTDFNALTFVA
jgi:hypothetical protein